MNPTARDGRRRLTGALALTFGAWLCCETPTSAGDGLFSWLGRHRAVRTDAGGTLGYGPPGVHPGYQGFGLGFHRGHGYGGDALGAGAEGGHPFYGGPGYNHPAPGLDRFKLTKIAPFPHDAGPGGPTPDRPQYFDGGPSPLVIDRPVISTGGGDLGGYGSFSGMLPYPDSTFAPFTSQASGESSSPGRTPPPSAPALLNPDAPSSPPGP
ncbi:hypothetical protein [Paludisphaera mucosa]|uniref:Uncharacterized protein n=1 Tax=Paludisphaera mucosa TaxID=3030827 RepID=A0ABT6FB57_9BACT|nr:hypothetical protein [Paludisphaera mucosa]MDG3004615.1 hypothetical protein [Paludisphaera mucosa]